MKTLRVHWGRFVGTVILLITPFFASAVDVEFFGVVKMQRFAQDNATAPALVEEPEPGEEPTFVFNAFIDLVSSNAVTNATLTLPGGGVRSLTLEDDGFVRDFSDGAEFKPDLDATYSNGTYTVFLQTRNDGNKSVPLTFPAGDAYPNPPRISNFSAAQSINPAANFTLTWDAFAGGLATDFIQVDIVEPNTDSPVFETAGPGAPGSLNGASTSVLIPAGTLPPGGNYRGRIFFAKIVDLDDTTYGSGVTGVAAFVVETVFEVRTTGGSDNTPPFLESPVPFNTQFNVKGSTVVEFTFSERMNTALPLASSIAWSNLNAALVTYTWSGDARALFCVYPPGLPINTPVSWQLNPAGSPENLRDLAGNKLPAQGGSFNTGSETGAGEKDVSFMALVKGRMFRQSGSVAQPLELYEFGMTSDLNTLNGVTNGLVTLPNARTVAPELDFGDAFDFAAAYSSQAQMDSFFPNGNHQVRFDTVHDGTRTFNFNLTGNAYPNAPQIVNFAATQSVNPSNSFVLSWGAFTGGTVSDFVMLEIQSDDDSSGGGEFETPNVGEPGALNGTNTSVTIPAFTFAPGRRYRGELLFVKVGQVDTTTYPGVIGASGYFTVTSFELQTLGTAIRPTVQISNLGNNLMRIVVTGERDRFYTIESTEAISGSPIFWQPRVSGTAIENVNGFTASFQFTDGALSPSGRRFYRAREGADFGGGP
jgi:hypothetical protein